jgi:hypothetical protein
MPKKFNFIVAAYLIFYGLLFSTINFDEKFDKALSIFLKNYNFIYNADFSNILTIVYLLSFILTVFSAIAMLFRMKYSQYVFVFGTIIGYSSYIFEVDTIYISTITEDLYESLLIFFEGALVALIMFNDDIGFKKGADEIS